MTLLEFAYVHALANVHADAQHMAHIEFSMARIHMDHDPAQFMHVVKRSLLFVTTTRSQFEASC